MGELARFEDIRIKMYPMDTQKHKEPHFHIILTDGNKASISISNGKILEGRLNKKTKGLYKSLNFERITIAAEISVERVLEIKKVLLTFLTMLSEIW